MIIPNQVRWTVTDLEGFPQDGKRYEIIDGELFVTRAPHWKHQEVAGNVYTQLQAWSRQLYQDLFPEVRAYEAFKYLHVGLISNLKRKRNHSYNR